MTLFSKIINKEIASYTILENEKFISFLDIFPVQKGHVLVVPKIEVDKIFDVPDNYLSELLVFAKPIAQAIEKAFPCNRISIVTIGLDVPHAHVHLIPINHTSDMLPTKEKLKYSDEEFKIIQQQIISYL